MGRQWRFAFFYYLSYCLLRLSGPDGQINGTQRERETGGMEVNKTAWDEWMDGWMDGTKEYHYFLVFGSVVKTNH
jgi:hypothetical protein